jgi:hypothetical protein
VDARSLSTERIVRCATCNHTWKHSPIKDVSILEIGEFPDTTSGEVLSSFTNNQKKLSLGWIIYSLTCCLIIIVSLIAREPLILSFPPLYKIYKSLGITAPPPAYGLRIENVSTLKKEHKGKTSFIIRGEILNTTSQVKILTPLHIIYKPSKNCHNVLKIVNIQSLHRNEPSPPCKAVHWTFTLPQDRLLAGEKIPFEIMSAIEPPAYSKGTIRF